MILCSCYKNANFPYTGIELGVKHDWNEIMMIDFEQGSAFFMCRKRFDGLDQVEQEYLRMR